MQNEPLFGDSSQYPGMYLSVEDRYQLSLLVHKKLLSSSLSTQLLSYDHNWDHGEYPFQQLAQQFRDRENVFGGVAWHCYGGEMEAAQEALHTAFPSTMQLLTECTGSYPTSCSVTEGMAGFGFNHEWDMQNLLLGGAGHWSSGALKWILSLDETCGPTLPTVTYRTGRPLVSIPSSAVSTEDVYFNQDYWSIAHMSKFLAGEVYRLESTTSMEGANILSQSFVRVDSNELVCIVMNLDHEHDVSIVIKEGETSFQDTLPPFSTKIYVW
jgi:glucosylceramidase